MLVGGHFGSPDQMGMLQVKQLIVGLLIIFAFASWTATVNAGSRIDL